MEKLTFGEQAPGSPCLVSDYRGMLLSLALSEMLGIQNQGPYTCVPTKAPPQRSAILRLSMSAGLSRTCLQTQTWNQSLGVKRPRHPCSAWGTCTEQSKQESSSRVLSCELAQDHEGSVYRSLSVSKEISKQCFKQDFMD